MNHHHRISTISTAITWLLVALILDPKTQILGQESSGYVRALEVLLAPLPTPSRSPIGAAPILMAQAQTPPPIISSEGDRVPATVDTNLVLQLARTPITLTNGHEMLGLSFFSDSNHNYVVEFRDDIGFDLCNQWQPLTNAPHNYGIVFTEGQATNRFFRLRRIETPRAPLFALLAHDTGTNSLDDITSDPSVTGMALQFPAGTELQASLNNSAGPFTVITNLGSPRYFLLTRDHLATLNGGSLPDGSHTLYLKAMNGATTLGSFDMPFTLDTAPPTVTVSLAPDFDSTPLGDGRTASNPVSLNGQTEPGTRLELLATASPGGASTPVIHQIIPDADGSFVLTNIVLAQGTNQFYFRALDAACNETITESQLCWYGSDCAFPDNLEGWQVAVSPTFGIAGSVAVAPDKLCTAVMNEGDSFLVTLSRDFLVPTIPSVLSLNYQAIFDTTTTHLMRDAFEVALVDSAGRPLTYTIQGTNAVTPASVATPPVLPPSPDALFNHTDGHAPFVAPGAVLTSQPSTSQLSTLLVDVRHLPPGSTARLILRLVNNDRDYSTSIRIADVRFKQFDASQGFLGTLGVAFSSNGLSVSSIGASTRNSDCESVVQFNAFGSTATVSSAQTRNQFPLRRRLLAANLSASTGDASGQFSPTLIAASGTGAFQSGLYVATPKDRKLIRVTRDGQIHSFADFDGSISAQSFGPYWPTLDPSGRYGGGLLVTAPGGFQNQIFTTDQAGNISVAFDFGTSNWDNETLAFDTRGAFSHSLFLVERFSQTIYRISTNGNVQPVGSGIHNGRQIDFGNGGLFGNDMFIANWGGGNILRIRPDLPLGQPAPVFSTTVRQPWGLAFGDGRFFDENIMFVTDTESLSILALNSNGEVTQVVADGFDDVGVLCLPHDGDFAGVLLMLERSGRLWALESTSSTRLELTIDSPANNAHLAPGATLLTGYALGSQLGVGQKTVSTNGFEIHFGEDVSPWPLNAPNDVPRPASIPNTQRAAATFGQRLPGVVAETFETYPTGSSPTNIQFGATVAVFSGSGQISTMIDTNFAFGGFFTISGSNGLVLNPNQAGFFAVDFSSPQAAFGFYGTDFGEPLGMQVAFMSATGTRREVEIPLTHPQGSGGAFFFGAIDEINPFVRVEFLRLGEADDAFALDDFSIATPAEVVLPTARSRITLVTVNGTPVDALDTAGNFFSAINVQPGQNVFEVVATDAFNQSTTNFVTVYGTTCPQNFASLGEVSASVLPEYGRTSFNEWTKVLYADLALRNAGTYPIRAPFYVGVTRISDPTVKLLAPDGVSADGIPYYDFSETLNTATLTTGSLTAPRALAFHNPNKAQFTYELVVLGQLNRAPIFTTLPALEIATNRVYLYDSEAVDPDGEILRYALLEAPGGMTIDPNTGLISWTATNVLGNYRVRVQADDQRGGSAEQAYLLSLISTPSNRPPYFVSTPVTVARVGTSFISSNVPPTGGRVFVSHDEWLVSDTGFQQEPRTVSFVNSLCAWFLEGTGRTNGRFHALSVDFSLNQGRLPQVMAAAGHNWTTGPLSLTPDVLKNVDAIFLAGPTPQGINPAPLVDYVRNGGNIYVAAGTGHWGYSDTEAVIWNPILSPFGLSYKPEWNYIGPEVFSFQSTHPLFDSTFSLYHYHGHSIVDLDPQDCRNAVLVYKGNEGLWAVFDPRGDCSQSQTNLGASLASYEYQALAVDPDRDDLTYALITGPTGLWINTLSGRIRWSPTADQIGTHNVSVRVEDGRGGSAIQSYRICVLAAEGNRAPIILSCPVTRIGPGETFLYAADALDPDSDRLEYSLVQAPAGMTINASDGLVMWSSRTAGIGSYAIGLRVSDGRGGTDEQAFIVRVTPGENCTLSGTVFKDANLDGVRDVGETEGAPSGWTVYLDENEDCRRNLCEPFTLTDLNGAYAFSNLTAGAYTVRLQVAPEWSLTSPTSETGNNLLLNGDFEEGVVPANAFPFFGTVYPGSNNITGWTVVSNAVDYAMDIWLPASGFRSIDLEGIERGGIAQTISTIPGKEYEVSFAMAGNNGGAPRIKRVQLSAAGQFEEFTFDTSTTSQSQMGWEKRLWKFTAVESSTYLQLLCVDPPDEIHGYGPVIDNVIVALRQCLGSHSPFLTIGQIKEGLDFGVTQRTNLANRSPSFTSTPQMVATPANRVLRYEASARDEDNDILRFVLVTHPEGMLVETNIGVVAWRPLLSQLGVHDVILRVQDDRGGVALQSWQITVVAPNSPPFITTFPPGPAVVELPYRYAIRAQDTESQPLAFALGSNTSAGISLTAELSTANSAVLSWTPALSNLGPNEIEIIVRDSEGEETRQTFNLEVVASAPNRPPAITSTPRTQARVGGAYAYVIEVTDPDGDPVTVDFESGPAGMVVTNAPELGFHRSLLYWPAAELGTHTIQIRASDGRNGTAEQQFTLNISSSISNQPPLITSLPSEHATAGQTYDYQLEATDPDGDVVTWRIVSGPVGMSLDSATGRLLWNSTLDQLGTNNVTAEASDALFATATQTFGIDVGCLNRPPQIRSAPPTTAQTGEVYLYAPRGSDPDEDRLSWSLVPGQFPTGMTIDGTNGLVRWNPTTNQVGNVIVSVKLSDGRGGNDTQTFTLYASDLRANKAPVIVTTPLRGATIGRPYAYSLRATDADGDTLTFQSLSPLPGGATFVPQPATPGTAVLAWIPTALQQGQHEFILTARDPAGASASQRFFVTVRTNEPPIIAPVSGASVLPLLTWRAQISAFDPDGDTLIYSLSNAPTGLTVDNLGRLSWTPLLNQVGAWTVTATVTDSMGASASTTFAVTVVTDTEAPLVQLEFPQSTAGPTGVEIATNTPLRIRVSAADNSGSIANLRLNVGGQALPLSTEGEATFIASQPGILSVVAFAEDASGNSGTATNQLTIFDPLAGQSLFVQIHSPFNNAVVSSPVPIIGSITSSAPLVSYSVELAPAAGLDLARVDQTLPGAQILTNATLPGGIITLNNVLLAQLDPTLLVNDDYVVRVVARDTGAKPVAAVTVVSVQGALKVGELKLEFTDLVVPLAGVPITIRRIYDSRLAGRVGDFGYGWSLGMQDAQVRVTLKDGTIFPGSRLTLSTPDGRRIGFTANHQSLGGGIFSALEGVNSRLFFRPDRGVYDQFQVPFDAVWLENGAYRSDLWSYQRIEPDQFTLITKDGVTNLYSRANGLERITDRNGNQLVFTKDGIFHYTAGSGTPDQQVPFVRDPQGRITRIVAPGGGALNYAYDGRGDLRSFADQASNVTRYAYLANPAHFLTNIVDFRGTNVLTAEFEGRRLVAIRDALGNPIRQDFDAESLTGKIRDANGTEIISRYDVQGNEAVRGIAGVSTNYFAYDANNNLLSSTNGRGFSTNYTYDARGNVTSIRDSLGNHTTVAYNDQNKPERVVNALGQTLHLRYDGTGNLQEVVNNSGFKTIVTRDGQGRVASLTDATGTNTTTFVYTGGCACGKPGKVINPDGSFKLSEYDSLGNTTRTVNELGAETLSSYDANGKLLWTRDPLSNYTRFFYSGPLLTNVVDALGRNTRYEYDALNRTNKIIDAEGGVVEFRYDNNGNRTHVIDAVTNVTTFIYDAGNRLVQQIDPLGHTNFFAYDAAGSRTEAIDRNGRRRTFTYDAANRMTNELWWEGTNIVRSIVFGFNELGVQTLAADPAARYEYGYDALNRLERVLSQSAGVPDFTLIYTYTALGQVVSVTDNWGVQVGSAYDNRNRLAQRRWQGPNVDSARVDFAYDVTGNRVRTERFADLAGTNRIGFTTNAYSRAGIVTNITHVGPTGTVLAKYDYNFDAAYQITRWAIGNQLSDFAYDRTGQLTNALNTAQPNESFHFDANGNRVGAQSGGSYVVGRNNQILGDGTNNYAYDAEGNMTSRSNTLTGVVTLYDFDHRNRLVSVLDHSPSGAVTQTVAFVYDVMNRRLRKTVNAQATRFLYNQNDSWADLDNANAIVARYLRGGKIDELIARHRATDGSAWYLTDHLRTVRDIMSSSGTIVQHIDYSSFGEILSASGSFTPDRFRFTGREFDVELGLHFYRARFYSPRLGRFVNPDPLGFAARDANLYRYVANSPTGYSDPAGLFLENAILRGAFIGASFGGAGAAAGGGDYRAIAFGATIGAVLGLAGGAIGAIGVPSLAGNVIGQTLSCQINQGGHNCDFNEISLIAGFVTFVFPPLLGYQLLPREEVIQALVVALISNAGISIDSGPLDQLYRGFNEGLSELRRRGF